MQIILHACTHARARARALSLCHEAFILCSALICAIGVLRCEHLVLAWGPGQ